MDGTTILPVGELSQLILGVLQEKGCGDVRWGERVVEVGDQEGVAWVVVESGEGGRKVRYEADFVVGCDGGASGVRRCLFGSGNFPGFTWEQQIVATNVSACQGWKRQGIVDLALYFLLTAAAGRPTTTSHPHGLILSSSFIPKTGIWLHEYHPLSRSGAYHTASFLASPLKSC